MKTTLMKKLLLAGILISSLMPHQARAMDGLEEGYSYTAMLAATAIVGGISYAMKQCCRGSASKPTQKRDTLRYQTFADWKQACDGLPTENPYYTETALDLNELMCVVRAYTDHEMSEGAFLHSERWLGSMPKDTDIYNGSFSPYAQKLLVKPDSHIAFHGDLHGDVHALNNFVQDLNDKQYMDGFRITHNDFSMIFLGDYTDRGHYGAEVWYTVLRLKLANPDRVFMVRGNHEDAAQNAQDGFLEELQTKFGGSTNNLCFQELQRLYNFLPLALYLGSGTADKTSYLLCCHGGLELGFDPKPLFADTRKNAYTLILDTYDMIDRAPGVEKLSKPVQQAVCEKVPAPLLGRCCMEKPITGIPHGTSHVINQIGFMWSDFILNPDDIIHFQNGRGWALGKPLTLEALALHSTKNHILKGIFRAHQHGDLAMMERILNKDQQGHDDDRGVGKLWTDHAKIKQPQAIWNGIVCTFSVAPAVFGKIEDCPFDYDAFGILKTASKFDDWRLEMIRVKERSDATSLSTDLLHTASSPSETPHKFASLAASSSNAHMSYLLGE